LNHNQNAKSQNKMCKMFQLNMACPEDILHTKDLASFFQYP
jgi:hypothetical protein